MSFNDSIISEGDPEGSGVKGRPEGASMGLATGGIPIPNDDPAPATTGDGATLDTATALDVGGLGRGEASMWQPVIKTRILMSE